MKRTDEAIEVYREAVETRPDDFPSHSLYNLLGMKLYVTVKIVLLYLVAYLPTIFQYLYSYPYFR